MTESNQRRAVPLSVSKEKKAKIFYEHGKDALELALLVANMQEEKALRKTEKHHQPQVGKSRTARSDRDRASDGRKRLEKAMATVAKRRAEAKKEKARSRKESNGRARERSGRDDAKITAPEGPRGAAPRKRVSFA